MDLLDQFGTSGCNDKVGILIKIWYKITNVVYHQRQERNSYDLEYITNWGTPHQHKDQMKDLTHLQSVYTGFPVIHYQFNMYIYVNSE